MRAFFNRYKFYGVYVSLQVANRELPNVTGLVKRHYVMVDALFYYLNIYAYYLYLPFPISITPTMMMIMSAKTLAVVKTLITISAIRALAQFNDMIRTAKMSTDGLIMLMATALRVDFLAGESVPGAPNHCLIWPRMIMVQRTPRNNNGIFGDLNEIFRTAKMSTDGFTSVTRKSPLGPFSCSLFSYTMAIYSRER